MTGGPGFKTAEIPEWCHPAGPVTGGADRPAAGRNGRVPGAQARGARGLAGP